MGESGPVVLPAGTLEREAPDAFAAIRDAPSALVSGEEPREAPLVTIAIPTYRRADLLREAIESALAQRDAPPFEVIVVSNDAEAAPTADPALDVVRAIASTHVRLYRNARNLGMEGNWNRCLELARGAWVTILHDDDLVAPDFLREIEPLLRSEEADFIACDSVVDADPARFREALAAPRRKLWRRPVGTDLHRLDPLRLLAGNVVAAPGAVLRRSTALALGGFRGELYPVADYELFARCCLFAHGVGLARTLTFYRLHPSAATLRGDTLVRMAALALALQARIPLRGPLSRLARPLIRAAIRVSWVETIAGGRVREGAKEGAAHDACAALGLPPRYGSRAFRSLAYALGWGVVRLVLLKNALAALPLARRLRRLPPRGG